jgi:small subunit ribosomal protein S6
LNLYEAMFLLNSAESKRDWDAMSGHVKGILLKHGAEVLKEEHWDDRKLAYDVAGQKRGTYYLIFFNLDPLKVATFRRDCELSEQIMRHLIIRHQGTEVPAYPALVHELSEGDFGGGEDRPFPRRERRSDDDRDSREE